MILRDLPARSARTITIWPPCMADLNLILNVKSPPWFDPLATVGLGKLGRDLSASAVIFSTVLQVTK